MENVNQLFTIKGNTIKANFDNKEEFVIVKPDKLPKSHYKGYWNIGTYSPECYLLFAEFTEERHMVENCKKYAVKTENVDTWKNIVNSISAIKDAEKYISNIINN